VLRHAKAAQGPADHARPLTDRGRRQAADLQRYLAAGGPPVPVPGTVLCSSARRAVQTAELVTAGMDPPPALMVERALYEADADDVLDRLRQLTDDDAAVMVVGHNPTLHHLVLDLLDEGDTTGRQRLDAGFPTAALAVVGLPDVPWSRTAPGTGTLLDLWTPDR